MKAFYRFFRGLHRWLIVNVCVLALFFALRGQRGLMNFWSQRVAMPVERALGALCSLVPFSVAELFYAAAVIALPVYLICAAAALRRTPYKKDVLYARALGLVNFVLSAAAALCLLWGVNYYADGFCARSGIAPEPVAVGDLRAVTAYFAARTAENADAVPRRADGTFAVPADEILAYAPQLYAGTVDAEFPFLRLKKDYAPKPIFFSRVMSATGFTGLYFPFTGECNVNADFPADALPATVAHELAHRRGIASEQECNFIAVLAASRSENAAYRYSGYLTGYIHLSNALYTADPSAWQKIRASLPPSVLADLNAANAYWAQFEGPTAEVSAQAYDAMLRGYGQELGIRSYGAVVDLLVAYYR